MLSSTGVERSGDASLSQILEVVSKSALWVSGRGTEQKGEPLLRHLAGYYLSCLQQGGQCGWSRG